MSTSPSHREAFWQEHIRNHIRSGLTIRDYCEHFDLNPPTFYVWRRRLQQDGRRAGGEPPVRFAVIETATLADSAKISITLTSGDRIELPSNIPSTSWHAMISALHRSAAPQS